MQSVPLNCDRPRCYRSWLLHTLGLLALCLPCAISAQQTLSFEDINTPTGCDTYVSLPTYQGFQLANLYAFNGSGWNSSPCKQGSFYSDGVVSGQNAIFDGAGEPASISATTPFTFTGGYFSAAWHDEIVVVSGTLDGANVFTTTLNLIAGAPARFSFSSDAVNALTFTPIWPDGAPIPITGTRTQFVADDLTFGGPSSTVVEPNSVVLVGTGLFGLLPTVCRRRMHPTVTNNAV